MLVRESILNETYESFSELVKLTNEILSNLNKKIDIGGKYYHINKLVNIENYKTLKDFINSGVGLFFSYRNAWDTVGGQFMEPETYKTETFSEYISESLLDKILKKLSTIDYTQIERDALNAEKLYKNFPMGFIIIYCGVDDYINELDFINDKKTYFHEQLIHELQHAYDFYRSKGKYATQKFINFFKKSGQYYTKETYTKYYRSIHELSAKFVEELSKINFFDRNNKIKKFDEIKNEMITAFGGLVYLTPKIKNMLMRKLSQYYYRIKEEHEKDK